MRLLNSSTVYLLLQTFDICTYFPGSMANPIHFSRVPHKINTLRLQKQEKKREEKSQFILPISYIKSKMLSFSTVGCFYMRFKKCYLSLPFLSFHNQACSYDKHLTCCGKLLQSNVYAKTNVDPLYVYCAVPETLMDQEFTHASTCFQESQK